jgi:hypothetical protein
MRRESVEKLIEAVRNGERIILVGNCWNKFLLPMAEYFGGRIYRQPPEFRNGIATGRLQEPVIRPRGPFAWLASGSADGRVSTERLLWQLDWKKTPELLESAVQLPARAAMPSGRLLWKCSAARRGLHPSTCESLAGKHLLDRRHRVHRKVGWWICWRKFPIFTRSPC